MDFQIEVFFSNLAKYIFTYLGINFVQVVRVGASFFKNKRTLEKKISGGFDDHGTITERV